MSPRLHALDGLRGTAALAILVFHAWLYTRTPAIATGRDGMDHVWHELRVAVVLFFVLSGYLLYRPWIAAALDRAPSPRTIPYALRRAARIVPAYWLAIIGTAALLWPVANSPGVRLPPSEELWRFFVFAQNFGENTVMSLDPPMWTLAVEVCFYALLPLIGWAATRAGASRRLQLAIPVALLVQGLAWNWWIAGRDLTLPYSKNLLAMLPYFAAGMLVAVLAHRRTLSRRSSWLLVAAGCAVVVANALWQSRMAIVDPESLAPRIVRDLAAAAGCGAVVAAVTAGPLGRGLLSGRLLAGAGTVSYGLYLWHVPVLVWLRAKGLLPLDPVGATLVVLPISLALAIASWRLVERPAIAWAQRRGPARARGERREPMRATAP